MSKYEKYLTEADAGGIEKGIATLFKRKFGMTVRRIDVTKKVLFETKEGIDPQEFEDLDKVDAIEDMLKKAYGKNALVTHDFNQWTVELI